MARCVVNTELVEWAERFQSAYARYERDRDDFGAPISMSSAAVQMAEIILSGKPCRVAGDGLSGAGRSKRRATRRR